MDSKFGARDYSRDSQFGDDSSDWRKDSTDSQTESDVSAMLGDDAPRHTLSVIGETLVFKGELIAEEDLLIQGRIEGSVKHNSTNLTVGPHGNVEADIEAKSVIVQGTVRGDIRSDTSVAVEPSARVHGNIYSPAIGLKEGAKFKGKIDMDFDPKAPRSAPETTAEPETSETSDAKSDSKGRSKTGKAKSGDGSSSKKDASSSKGDEPVSDESVNELLEGGS
jgi:cytoskeletal protein CcmA (bactofilin family)